MRSRGLIAAGHHMLDSCFTDGWFQANGGNVTQMRRINSWQKRKRTFQFNLATSEQLDELPSELNTGLSARERGNIHGVIVHAEQSGQHCHKLQRKWGTEELSHLSNTQPLTHKPHSILNRQFTQKWKYSAAFVFHRKKNNSIHT